MEEVRTMRVLVVDDEESVRAMLEVVLELEGIEVDLATDGDEALELAQADPPDAIVLDVMMPRMDGWTVAEALRADPETAHVPILFCSALTSEAHVREGWALGASSYVLKPFSTEDLVAELRRVVAPPPPSVAV